MASSCSLAARAGDMHSLVELMLPSEKRCSLGVIENFHWAWAEDYSPWSRLDSVL